MQKFFVLIGLLVFCSQALSQQIPVSNFSSFSDDEVEKFISKKLSVEQISVIQGNKLRLVVLSDTSPHSGGFYCYFGAGLTSASAAGKNDKVPPLMASIAMYLDGGSIGLIKEKNFNIMGDVNEKKLSMSSFSDSEICLYALLSNAGSSMKDMDILSRIDRAINNSEPPVVGEKKANGIHVEMTGVGSSEVVVAAILDAVSKAVEGTTFREKFDYRKYAFHVTGDISPVQDKVVCYAAVGLTSRVGPGGRMVRFPSQSTASFNRVDFDRYTRGREEEAGHRCIAAAAHASTQRLLDLPWDERGLLEKFEKTR